ncbi:MAG: hypothetical protein GDA48_00010 [Hormoscilla sp. GM102CHS1]|nr:hypothetical protein [Hormoscilla sp. SP12CHS1]MBC6471414.1 hypothetical protein [Hormoscilla sp. GM102CHS1]
MDNGSSMEAGFSLLDLLPFRKNRGNKRATMGLQLNYLEFNGNAYNCAIAREITERQQTESALGEREERFRYIFADSLMAI